MTDDTYPKDDLFAQIESPAHHFAIGQIDVGKTTRFTSWLAAHYDGEHPNFIDPKTSHDSLVEDGDPR